MINEVKAKTLILKEVQRNREVEFFLIESLKVLPMGEDGHSIIGMYCQDREERKKIYSLLKEFFSGERLKVGDVEITLKGAILKGISVQRC